MTTVSNLSGVNLSQAFVAAFHKFEREPEVWNKKVTIEWPVIRERKREAGQI